MSGLSGTVSAAIQATQDETAGLSQDRKDVARLDGGGTFAHGTGDDQCDLLYHDSVEVDNESVALDLSDGSLKDKFGNALTFVEVREIGIRNTSTTAGEYVEVIGGTDSLDVGPGTSPIRLQPGGAFILRAPKDGDGYVVDASHHYIYLDTTGSGATVTVELMVLGVSA